MAASDATPFPIKNQAYRVTFPILDADGDLVTGATGLDSETSADGGTFADCTNEATEIATSSGVYYLDLTAGEMNADTVAVIVKTSSSGAKTTTLILYPITNGLDIPVNVTYFGGSAGTFSSGRPEVNATHFAGTAYATALAAEVDAVWDEVITGAAHNVVNSAGRRLRLIDAAFEVHAGTAQAGSTATTFVMDTGASAVDDIYNGDRIVIIAGTGAEEHGLITDYVGATRTATMSKSWVVTPDNTSEFAVLPADCDVESWNNTAATGDGDWAELQTDVDAILVDTGTTLDGKIDTIDTVVDAIKAKTDSLAFTVAGQVDANIQYVNDVLVNGDGSPGTEWGP